MKQMFLSKVTLILIGLYFSVASAQSQKPTTKAPVSSPEVLEEQVRTAERKWLDALYRLDLVALEGSESDDFTLITPPAVITKQEHLAVVRERLGAVPQLNSAQSPVKYSVTQQTIRLYGTIALVMDVHSVESADQDLPITSPGRYWQTEVWKNEGGNWKLVHLHMTPVAPHRM